MSTQPRQHHVRWAGEDTLRMPPDRAALLADLLGKNGRLHVVSNRGPITFELDPDVPAGLTAGRGAGGLVTALVELGRHAPVSWTAAALTEGDKTVSRFLQELGDPAGPGGNGSADHAATLALVRALIEGALPHHDVRLRYEVLPEDVFDGYYRVVANPLLWFLQHQMYALPLAPNIDSTMVAAWRQGYRAANERLAEAAVAAAGGAERPLFLVQDYHLYLAPARIRELLPDASILHFTHIPWPPDSIWQVLPQGMRRAICEGLLASDIVGLQTDRYANHFMDTVASFVRDARIDPDSRLIRWRDRRVRVRTYPISVDPDGLAEFARSAPVEERVARLRGRLQRVRPTSGGPDAPLVIVRADRIEPSKNVLRGFVAFEALLVKRPELRQRVRFVAVQAPTRTSIPEYAHYAAAVREVVARINGLAEPDDQPIWIYDGSDYAMAIAALRLADVVMVNPVVDGMNLVAKEAVLVGERDPVLLLSETAGAAEQLAADSLIVAPADVAGTADQLERALLMPADERRARTRRLRYAVREQDIEWWLTRQLRDLAAVRRGEHPPSRRLRDTVRRIEEPLLS
ncbi:MAG: trehalose-6-phosphate synthase [Chloroflexi bacterium]|nr:MAG: trehalose-6-phosphate synthase [Chloroflexota bacterium]